jgi:hypothetical protein
LQFRGSPGCFGEQQATKVDLIINLKTAKAPASPCCCPKADVNATLLDDRIGSNGRVRSLISGTVLVAQRSANDSFRAYTARPWEQT